MIKTNRVTGWAIKKDGISIFSIRRTKRGCIQFCRENFVPYTWIKNGEDTSWARCKRELGYRVVRVEIVEVLP